MLFKRRPNAVVVIVFAPVGAPADIEQVTNHWNGADNPFDHNIETLASQQVRRDTKPMGFLDNVKRQCRNRISP
jgi:hypothetical protein